MITFRGVPVLEAGDLSIGPGVDQEQRDEIVMLGSGVGARVADLPWTTPRVEGWIDWTCEGETQVRSVREFVDARMGRRNTFWLPSFTRDFEQVKIVSPVEDFYVFNAVGYASRVFGMGECRRNFYVERQAFDGTLTGETFAFTASSAGDWTPGESERVFGYPTSTSGWAKMEMMYLVRMAVDVVSIEWTTRKMARVRIPFVEVPKEVEALP